MDINILKFNKMKTADNFHKKKIYCRYATLKAESPPISKKISRHDSFRERIRTTISMDDEDYQSSPLPFDSSNSPTKIMEKHPQFQLKKDEDDFDNLTTDFKQEWERNKKIKSDIYSKLRSQMVRKYPSYLEKYKDEELDQELRIMKTEKSESNKFERTIHSESEIRDSLKQRSPIHKRNQNLYQIKTFYSRSKKKCLTNHYQNANTIQEKEQKIIPIPRLSFIAYMQKPVNKNCLKGRIVKGVTMMKKKEDILCLQKEGSKSYAKLKKYLEDAIQTCKKK